MSSKGIRIREEECARGFPAGAGNDSAGRGRVRNRCRAGRPRNVCGVTAKAGTHAPTRRERAGTCGHACPRGGLRGGAGFAGGAGGAGKKERAPRGFSSRGVSRKRHVLTCRGGESERLDGVPAGHRRERLRVKTKRPPAVLAGGLENPAATYSPGSEDQVPSAMWGLTSVFGMGTGMTPTRLPLKQTLHGI